VAQGCGVYMTFRDPEDSGKLAPLRRHGERFSHVKHILQILLFYSQIMASLLSKIFYQQVLVAF
jgi:hypothetical protein